MAVAVVTDTTHYMPSEVVGAYGISVVSLYVHWNGREDRESAMGGFDAFYEWMRGTSEVPTTSQPSVGDFLAVFEPILERGDDIVSVHLSGGLSGTVGSAEQARDELVSRGIDGARIEVVDSMTGCAGHGYTAIAAANAARRGATAAETAQAARHCREGVRIIFSLDTLEYLRRGGRVGRASAYLGTALKIKPVLTIENEVEPVARVRTASRVFDYLVAHLEERRAEGCDVWCVQHIQASESAARLVERGREIYGTEPEYVSEIGPVIGTYAGPGLLGVSAVRRALLDASSLPL